jgi:hypothetical protein
MTESDDTESKASTLSFSRKKGGTQDSRLFHVGENSQSGSSFPESATSFPESGASFEECGLTSYQACQVPAPELDVDLVPQVESNTTLNE